MMHVIALGALVAVLAIVVVFSIGFAEIRNHQDRLDAQLERIKALERGEPRRRNRSMARRGVAP